MQKEADANRSRKEEYDSFPMYQAQAPMNGSASNSGHGLNTGGSMAHVVDGGNNANDGGARAASTGEGGNLLSPSPVLESVFPGLRASISSQIAESGGGGGSASMKTPLSNLYASSPSSSSNDEEAENVPPQSSSATAAATSSFGKPPKIKTLQEGEQQGDAEEDAHIGIFTASSTLPEGLEDIDHENVPSGNPAASSSSTTTSASQDPRIRQKHRGQVSSSAAAGGGKSTRVHPDIVARALEDTTLAVIPATAFQKLAEKFPAAAAGIVLVILIRFQRVTFK